MPNYTINISEPDVEVEEDIQGEQLFTWRSVILGILAGGKDYVSDINKAIEEAYAER